MFRRLVRVVLGILDAWDKWVTVAAALGVPTTVVGYFISLGMPPEAIALAIMAGIGFAVVIFTEGRPMLEQLRRSKFGVFVEQGLGPERPCLDCVRLNYFRVGVWNQTLTTANDVHVYLESLDGDVEWSRTGMRELAWLGEPFGAGKTLHPSSRAGHSHVSLVEESAHGDRMLFIQGPHTLDENTEYPITIVIQGRDVKPVQVTLFLILSEFPPLSTQRRRPPPDDPGENSGR